jgi:hypothetical protein
MVTYLKLLKRTPVKRKELFLKIVLLKCMSILKYTILNPKRKIIAEGSAFTIHFLMDVVNLVVLEAGVSWEEIPTQLYSIMKTMSFKEYCAWSNFYIKFD